MYFHHIASIRSSRFEFNLGMNSICCFLRFLLVFSIQTSSCRLFDNALLRMHQILFCVYYWISDINIGIFLNTRFFPDEFTWFLCFFIFYFCLAFSCKILFPFLHKAIFFFLLFIVLFAIFLYHKKFHFLKIWYFLSHFPRLCVNNNFSEQQNNNTKEFHLVGILLWTRNDENNEKKNGTK